MINNIETFVVLNTTKQGFQAEVMLLGQILNCGVLGHTEEKPKCAICDGQNRESCYLFYYRTLDQEDLKYLTICKTNGRAGPKIDNTEEFDFYNHYYFHICDETERNIKEFPDIWKLCASIGRFPLVANNKIQEEIERRMYNPPDENELPKKEAYAILNRLRQERAGIFRRSSCSKKCVRCGRLPFICLSYWLSEKQTGSILVCKNEDETYHDFCMKKIEGKERPTLKDLVSSLGIHLVYPPLELPDTFELAKMNLPSDSQQNYEEEEPDIVSLEEIIQNNEEKQPKGDVEESKFEEYRKSFDKIAEQVSEWLQTKS